MNSTAFGVERGTLIRVPATANLMIDSADRDINRYPNPFEFTINKQQPYVTGFFSRIGATEVVMEWCYDNIQAALDNDTLELDISGTPIDTTVRDGNYTVEQLLETIVATFNADNSGVYVMVLDTANGQTVLSVNDDATGQPLDLLISQTNLSTQLNLSILPNTNNKYILVGCPDLRPFRYIDIVCEQLTSVQDARDATTQSQDRNVLVRWYFSFDDPPQLDAYGFPILMGYTRFCLRRLYNPPKQIKWEQNLPISNLSFACYDQTGSLVVTNPDNNILLTLQLSEG